MLVGEMPVPVCDRPRRWRSHKYKNLPVRRLSVDPSQNSFHDTGHCPQRQAERVVPRPEHLGFHHPIVKRKTLVGDHHSLPSLWQLSKEVFIGKRMKHMLFQPRGCKKLPALVVAIQSLIKFEGGRSSWVAKHHYLTRYAQYLGDNLVPRWGTHMLHYVRDDNRVERAIAEWQLVS